MPHRNRYLLFTAFFLGAAGFLWLKATLYDKLEYQTDLFSVLQLSRDFLWGKPFLYENAYGDNTAFHNYYLMPLYAPFTVAFGGKGLFVAGFAAMLWAGMLTARLFASKPLWQGISFQVLFFSPAAFYLWDNYRFGWHPENLYYPLCVVFVASSALKNKTSLWLSALFIFLNREDGILLLWALYMAYRAASPQKPATQPFKVTLAAGVLFLAGLGLLYLRSPHENRMAAAAQRFILHYTPQNLETYLETSCPYWLGLCLPVLGLALLRKKSRAFTGWGLAGLAVLLVTNVYAAAYYFPDTRYGITWAPRLASTYGYLVALALLAFVYGKPVSVRTAEPVFLLLTLGTCYLQYGVLKALPSYDRYSVLDRVHLALFRRSPMQKDPQTLAKLSALADRLPRHYPVRLDEPLFALFEQADCQWPQEGRNPWQTPKMLVMEHPSGTGMMPLPPGFEKIDQIGVYEVWIETGSVPKP